MKKWAIILAIGLVCLAIGTFGMTEEEIDYKANFIVKLINYVEWPANAAGDATKNVIIAMVGDSPLFAPLQKLAAEKAEGGRTITVKKFILEEPLSDCHILFISTKETAELAKILKKTNGNPILTVSDCEYFANYGVMINFYPDEGKVKFEVNQIVVKDTGLKISSQLLKLARII